MFCCTAPRPSKSWLGCALDSVLTLSRQHTPPAGTVLVLLCGEDSEALKAEGLRRQGFLGACVCLRRPGGCPLRSPAAVCSKYKRKCWAFPRRSPKVWSVRHGAPNPSSFFLSSAHAHAHLSRRLRATVVGRAGPIAPRLW